MCLSVPAKVVEVLEKSARVEMGQSQFVVSTALLESVELGDYLLIHTGFAIDKITPEAASEMVRMLREIIGTS